MTLTFCVRFVLMTLTFDLKLIQLFICFVVIIKLSTQVCILLDVTRPNNGHLCLAPVSDLNVTYMYYYSHGIIL